MMREYKWRHTAILYDQDYVFFNLAGSNLALDFKDMSDIPRPLDIPFKAKKLSDPGALLQDASKQARRKCKTLWRLSYYMRKPGA